MIAHRWCQDCPFARGPTAICTGVPSEKLSTAASAWPTRSRRVLRNWSYWALIWSRSVVRTFTIGLGKESTPTPNGTFYIISLLRPPTGSSTYGPYAYGLSAFSDAITDWAGGAVIGIHGTDDPSSIGNRKSHGCIRMRNRDIEYLVPILPLGTPVEIR